MSWPSKEKAHLAKPGGQSKDTAFRDGCFLFGVLCVIFVVAVTLKFGWPTIGPWIQSQLH